MKKNRRIVIISLLLIAVAAFFIYRNQSGTIRKEDRDFAVKDTNAINKVFIADRGGSSVTLERQPDQTWTVNKKYIARKDGIDLLFDCFSKIRVQTRVSRNAYNNVIKELATKGIKCEIYLNNESKPSKVYYIGGSTADVLGTYMMLENSTVPFVTEVPGFDGYLTPRYSATERDWRETLLFNYSIADIKSVTIQYNYQLDKSFTIEQTGNKFAVSSPVSDRKVSNPDTIKIKNYLTVFRNLHFETWDKAASTRQIDSLQNVTPSTVLTITDMKGKKTSLPMYPKPNTISSLARVDSSGKQLKFDVDRMYSFIEDSRELVTIQYFIFDKVFATIDDFDLSRSHRKSTHN